MDEASRPRPPPRTVSSKMSEAGFAGEPLEDKLYDHLSQQTQLCTFDLLTICRVNEFHTYFGQFLTVDLAQFLRHFPAVSPDETILYSVDRTISFRMSLSREI